MRVLSQSNSLQISAFLDATLQIPLTFLVYGLILVLWMQLESVQGSTLHKSSNQMEAMILATESSKIGFMILLIIREKDK